MQARVSQEDGKCQELRQEDWSLLIIITGKDGQERGEGRNFSEAGPKIVNSPGIWSNLNIFFEFYIMLDWLIKFGIKYQIDLDDLNFIIKNAKSLFFSNLNKDINENWLYRHIIELFEKKKIKTNKKTWSEKFVIL